MSRKFQKGLQLIDEVEDGQHFSATTIGGVGGWYSYDIDQATNPEESFWVNQTRKKQAIEACTQSTAKLT